jgi:hypothetical protein
LPSTPTPGTHNPALSSSRFFPSSVPETSPLRPHGPAGRMWPFSSCPLVAIAVRAQRQVRVCLQPLMNPGFISAPWPPSSCARLPHSQSWPVVTFPQLPPHPGAPYYPSLGQNGPVSPTTMLSITQRRCRPAACSVCRLPLSHGRDSASWPPIRPGQAPVRSALLSAQFLSSRFSSPLRIRRGSPRPEDICAVFLRCKLRLLAPLLLWRSRAS